MSDLRERVARAICAAHGDDPDIACLSLLHGKMIPCWEMYYAHFADAAIALVLEEAAKECERMEGVFAPQQVITGRCAAAIRAMKGKPNPGSGS